MSSSSFRRWSTRVASLRRVPHCAGREGRLGDGRGPACPLVDERQKFFAKGLLRDVEVNAEGLQAGCPGMRGPRGDEVHELRDGVRTGGVRREIGEARADRFVAGAGGLPKAVVPVIFMCLPSPPILRISCSPPSA